MAAIIRAGTKATTAASAVHREVSADSSNMAVTMVTKVVSEEAKTSEAIRAGHNLVAVDIMEDLVEVWAVVPAALEVQEDEEVVVEGGNCDFEIEKLAKSASKTEGRKLYASVMIPG